MQNETDKQTQENTALKKAAAYVGFSIRSGKILFGTDSIEQAKRGVRLIAFGEELSENGRKPLKKAKAKFNCPLVICKSGIMQKLTARSGVKALALKDENLATAFMASVEQANGLLELYSGGED